MNRQNPIEPDPGAEAAGESAAAPSGAPGSRAPELGLEELIRQHRELDERLNELAQAPHLTPGQQYDALVMKKRKLALKDRIAALAPS